MTEQFKGIPDNLKISREASQTASSGQTREQIGSARENIHNAYMDMQQRLRSSRRGTVTEIRDRLRQQEIRRELEEMAAFRTGLDEKLNNKREETLSQNGGEKVTVGKMVLKLLAGLLSAPAELAEQAANDSKQQAEQAA